MTTQVIKTYGPGKDLQSSDDLYNFIVNLDPVASDTNTSIVCYSSPTFKVEIQTMPKSCSDTQRILVVPAAGMSVNDLNKSTYNLASSSGLQIGVTGKNANLILGPGVDITGFNIEIGNTIAGLFFKGHNSNTTNDNIITKNRINITGYDFSCGDQASTMLLTDNLIVNQTTYAGIHDKWVLRPYRNTFVALGSGVNTAQAINSDYSQGGASDGNVYINFGGTITNTPSNNEYSNTTPTGGTTSGITVVKAAGGLVTNETNDFRPSSGGGLIGKGSASAKGTLDILSNNRGNAPDAGSWQLAAAAALPTGSITSITVSGQTVTVSGTSTGSPTSGSVSLSPTNTAYNSATLQGPVTATLGTNTFTATFSNVPVGQYSPTATLTNGGGTQAATNNAGTANVTGAQGTLSSQTLDGQNLTLTGTTTGNPTSATIIVPAAASNPNGATSVGPNAVTLGNGTFTVTVPLTPGNYDPSIVRFTNAAGTSLPMSGPTAVSIASIQGNPSAPNSSDTTAPVMQGVLSTTNILATGYTLNWQAATDDVAVGGYEVSTDGGSTYTDVGNVLTRVITGKSQNTTYNNRVRAYDTSGNRAATPLSNTATTQTATDTTAPTMQGSITSSNITQTGYTLNWQAATDDTGVTGYEVSTDAGNTYSDVGNVLTKAVTGKTASTTYNNRVRAYDAAGNRATPLSNSVTTSAPGSSTASTAVILTVANGAQYRASLQDMKWYWYDTPNIATTPVDSGDASSLTKDGFLVINMPDSMLTSGSVGWLVVTDIDDFTKIPFKVFYGPVRVA